MTESERRRRKKFEQEFRMLWATYRMNKVGSPEYRAVAAKYYGMTGGLDSFEFASFFCKFGKKFPTPDEYVDTLARYMESRRRDNYEMIPKTDKDTAETSLAIFMIKRFWQLLGFELGKKLFCLIYYLKCMENGLDLPGYWRNFWADNGLCLPDDPRGILSLAKRWKYLREVT